MKEPKYGVGVQLRGHDPQPASDGEGRAPSRVKHNTVKEPISVLPVMACVGGSNQRSLHGGGGIKGLICHIPGGSSGKEPACNAGDVRDTCLIPGLGRSPGGGHGDPLQYSCLETPMDRGGLWSEGHKESNTSA